MVLAMSVSLSTLATATPIQTSEEQEPIGGPVDRSYGAVESEEE